MSHINTVSAGNDGFTLVEVMTGVGVFSVAMLSVFMVFSQSISTFADTRDSNRINQTMQYQMESLRGMEWTDILGEVGTNTIKVDANGIPTEGTSEIPYDWRAFNMVQKITLEKTDHYRVELTAEWTDSKGGGSTRVMKTWLTNDGLNEYYTQSTN
ncbi:MAG: type IV pilus modification PilV family protein [Opitutales bacterium]